jgi:hypothetical protein
MDYTYFQNYPLQILGIDESYNDELIDIEDFIKSDIAYSGDVLDLIPILPYFVFHNFCFARLSDVVAISGERASVAEFTIPSNEKLKSNWNIGVEKLTALCSLKTTTAKDDYLKEYSLFGII